MNSVHENNNAAKTFISPAGAILAIICFFLPWAKFSMIIQQTFIGFKLVEDDAYLLLVLIAPAAILGVFFYMKSRNQVWKSKPYLLISSCVALLVLLYEFIQFNIGVQTPWGNYTPKDVGFSLQFGFYGTIIAFVISAIGGLLLTEDEIGSFTETNITTCPNCGAIVKWNANYCEDCGASIHETQTL
jgi:hypothetical protein